MSKMLKERYKLIADILIKKNKLLIVLILLYSKNK